MLRTARDMAMGSRMIKVVLVDDHALVREGLRQLFAYAPNVQLLAEFARGEEVLVWLARNGAGCDLLLLDLSMPGLGGLQLLRQLTASFPQLPVLVLSMHDEPAVAQRALAAGAAGFLTKDSDPETLLDAVRHVAAGERLTGSGGRL